MKGAKSDDKFTFDDNKSLKVMTLSLSLSLTTESNGRIHGVDKFCVFGPHQFPRGVSPTFPDRQQFFIAPTVGNYIR